LESFIRLEPPHVGCYFLIRFRLIWGRVRQFPPGNLPPNSVKFFATLVLLELVKDSAWLAKVTNALNQHWQKKNAAKKNPLAKGLTNRHCSGDNMAMAESSRDPLNT